MSSAHGDDHGGHDFDPEPAKTLSADEPRTPGWIPAIGAALFAIAGIALLATSDDTPGMASAKPIATAEPAGQQPQRPLIQKRDPPAVAAPAPSQDPKAPSGRTRYTPEQMEKVKKALDSMKANKGAAPPGH